MNRTDNANAMIAAAICMLAFASALRGDAAPVNLLENPGFETGDFAGWTIGGNSLQVGVSLDGTPLPLAHPVFSGNAANARSGQYAAHGLIRTNVDFVSPFTEIVTLSQFISVAPNQTASIGFYLGSDASERYGATIGDDYLQVFVDGIGLFPSGHSNIAYGDGPDDFTLIDAAFNTGLRTQLEITFVISGSGTGRVNASFDDFFVYAVPEPGGCAILCTGATAIATVMRRRPFPSGMR
jgi:hypothetical protein